MTAVTLPGRTAAGRAPGGVLAAAARTGLAAWAIVAVLVAVLTVANPGGFWAAANIANVLTATVVLGLVALGQHLVVLTGGIDLSVGSTATLSALLTAMLIDGYPIRTIPAILAMLLLGAAIGTVHGLIVSRTRIPAFVVTLSTFYLIQGIAFLISTTPAGQVTRALVAVGMRRWGPFPLALAVLAVAVAVVAVLLYRTRFGRHVHAVGGDQAAARSAGVPVRRTLVLAFVIAGTLAAAAGVMLAARATIGSPSAGQGLELSAITVVVVGGASLLGGRASLTGTLGGVALLALVESSFTLLQFPATASDLIRGVVILAAAALFVPRTSDD
ncbi:ABC transporter permease [Actinomadura rugatobispora]|uniref:ABC transporter permease n=1 Tax=Actinomadura rugatobispora TaxID=1994 RepID=A0ABW0ZY26_9ACTN|nr:ABC transporter permease [Actinomadura rugatobispora]